MLCIDVYTTSLALFYYTIQYRIFILLSSKFRYYFAKSQIISKVIHLILFQLFFCCNFWVISLILLSFRTIFFFLLHTAVKSIKKQQLVEIRTMANPPAVVKLALESICLLLGENASDWKSIRAVIMRDNFINTVVSNFNTEDIRYACCFLQ